MYEISIGKSFSAAHSLRGYDGNCACLHGHNWQVKATLRVQQLDEIGIACDFKKLKREVDKAIGKFDHVCLNETESFASCNPTSENIARVIYQELSAKLNDGNVKDFKVEVSESPNSTAAYFD